MHSSYQRVVQGKCPLSFLTLTGVVCSNTLFSNTSALTSSLLFWGNSTCNVLEHLVCSNTSVFQFWGPLARTNVLSALCGLPKQGNKKKTGKGRTENLKILSVKKSPFVEIRSLFFPCSQLPVLWAFKGSHVVACQSEEANETHQTSWAVGFFHIYFC